MRTGSYLTAAVAGAAILALCAGYEPASAQRGDGGRGGGAGVSSGGGGGHASGGGRSGGAVHGSPGRSFSGGSGSHGYAGSRGAPDRGYVSRHYDRGNRHVHRRGHRHFYGYAPFGIYAYSGSCDYYYRRAVATGLEYWWDRYYDCIGD